MSRWRGGRLLIISLLFCLNSAAADDVNLLSLKGVQSIWEEEDGTTYVNVDASIPVANLGHLAAQPQVKVLVVRGDIDGRSLLCFRGHPTLNHLVFTRARVTVDLLANLSQLRNISSLSFRSCYIEGNAFTRLVPMELKSLEIEKCETSPDTESLWLRDMQTLDTLHLTCKHLTAPKELPAHLTTLRIGMAVQDSSLEPVLQCTKLSSLTLFDARIPTRMDWSRLPSLRRLGFRRSSVEKIRDLPEFLEVLNIESTQVGQTRCVEWKCPRLSELQISDVDMSMVDFEGIDDLRSLHMLILNNCNITREQLMPIVKCEPLTVLWLADNRLNDESVLTVLSLPKLRDLDVSCNAITDNVVPQLAACQGLKKLNIAKTKVTSRSLAMLANMPDLAELDISGNGMPEVDIQPFIRRHNVQKVGPYIIYD